MEVLTPAKTAPYLITLSTDFSMDPVISGEYFSSNPSSSWSDERRASAYANVISWREWAVVMVRTVAFEENSTSREQICFPTATASVLHYQVCAGGLAITTDSLR